MKNTVLIFFPLLFLRVNFTSSAFFGRMCYQCDITKKTSFDKMCDKPVAMNCTHILDDVMCVKGTPKEGTNATIYSCANEDEAGKFVRSCQHSKTPCDKLICDSDLCNKPPYYHYPTEDDHLQSERIACHLCIDWLSCHKPVVTMCPLGIGCSIGYSKGPPQVYASCFWRKNENERCRPNSDECYECYTSFCNRWKGMDAAKTTTLDTAVVEETTLDTAVVEETTFDKALGEETTVSNYRYNKNYTYKKRNFNSNAMVPKNNKMLLFGLVISVCLQAIP